MKNQSTGFTLIEMLSSMVIISILAMLSIAAFVKVKNVAKATFARSEIATVQSAFFRYRANYYGNIPGLSYKLIANNPEITSYTYTSGLYFATNNLGRLVASNNAIMACIMDLNFYPNEGHLRNPHKMQFMEKPKNMDSNFNLLDPWRNPYVITVDLGLGLKDTINDQIFGNNLPYAFLMYSLGPDKSTNKAGCIKM